VLFLDEVHRFNKAQQDTFLPYLEDGTLTFVGATTENPSFEVISALLSRARVYVLRALTPEDLSALLAGALSDRERGLGRQELTAEPEAMALMARAADGDGRRALNMLELAASLAEANSARAITEAVAQEVAGGGLRRFDKGGDQFYEQISALHKSVRGSDPDAALYWLCRMLDGGCDPSYLARRIVRMAVEDVGLADPRALALTIDAWEAYDRLGSPEGELVGAAGPATLPVRSPRPRAVPRRQFLPAGRQHQRGIRQRRHGAPGQARLQRLPAGQRRRPAHGRVPHRRRRGATPERARTGSGSAYEHPLSAPSASHG